MPNPPKRKPSPESSVPSVSEHADEPFPWTVKVMEWGKLERRLRELGIATLGERYPILGKALLDRLAKAKTSVTKEASELKGIVEPEAADRPAKKGHSRVLFSSPPAVLYGNFNWWPFDAQERSKLRKSRGPRVFTPCRGVESGDRSPQLPHNVPALITLRIPISDRSVWDLARLMDRIRRIVRAAIENRPTLHEAPTMTNRVPPQRMFLLRCGEAEFRRDLLRYKLHERKGLSYRQIAFWEASRKGGAPFRKESIPSRVKHQVKGESSVRRSVERIVAAIYLEPYKARRRRIDHPARGIPAFRCAIHGRDCPRDCANLVSWVKETYPLLPTDDTGKPWGRVKLSDPLPADTLEDFPEELFRNN